VVRHPLVGRIVDAYDRAQNLPSPTDGADTPPQH
jgi:phosphate starvation-inducible protein PhoH